MSIETNVDGAYPWVTVDDGLGAIYIYLMHPDTKVRRTQSYDNHRITVDFDFEGSPIGIEILL